MANKLYTGKEASLDSLTSPLAALVSSALPVSTAHLLSSPSTPEDLELAGSCPAKFHTSAKAYAQVPIMQCILSLLGVHVYTHYAK